MILSNNTNKRMIAIPTPARSEEHTSELQSRPHLVCRLLLEKKKKKKDKLLTPANNKNLHAQYTRTTLGGDLYCDSTTAVCTERHEQQPTATLCEITPPRHIS